MKEPPFFLYDGFVEVLYVVAPFVVIASGFAWTAIYYHGQYKGLKKANQYNYTKEQRLLKEKDYKGASDVYSVWFLTMIGLIIVLTILVRLGF